MRLKIIDKRVKEIKQEKEFFEETRHFLEKINELGSFQELEDYKRLQTNINAIIKEKEKDFKSVISDRDYLEKKIKVIKIIASFLLAITLITSIILLLIQKSTSSIVIVFVSLVVINVLLLFKEYEVRITYIFFFLLISALVFTLYVFVPDIKMIVDSYSSTITLCSFLLSITTLFINFK